jgi:Bacterial RNA polymerase, alpha chain C terminal domain
VSERNREPLFFEEQEKEEPEPGTASAGGVAPPGRIGSGLWDDDSGEKDWLLAPIEDLNLSMRAYSSLRESGLITVGLILGKTEDELLASLAEFSGGSFLDVLLTIEEPGDIVREPDRGSQTALSRAHKSYDELRERLHELGVMSVDDRWDSARGVN